MDKIFQIPKEFGVKWVEALRNTPEEKHGIAEYYDKATGCYCAMGLGLHTNGIKFDTYGDPIVNEGRLIFHETEARNKRGLTLWDVVMDWNDFERLSFAAIADNIEQTVEFI